MGVSSSRSKLEQFLVVVAAFVIVVAGMKAAKSILVPFLLSAFVAIICAPALYWMEKRRIPTVLAILILLVALVALCFGLGAMVGSSANSFQQDLSKYQHRLQKITEETLAWLGGMGIRISEEMVSENFDPKVAMGFVGDLLGGLSSTFSNLFMILTTVVFILLEVSSFPIKVRAVFGASGRSDGSFDRIIADIRRYMAIKTVFSLLTGVFVWIWLAVIGVDYAVLWGLLAFLLNYVPTIGSIIAAIPAIALALVQLGVGPALWTAGGFLLVNVAVGSILEPRFMGQGLGLSTLVVFLSLVFWGWVLGYVGMLLSAPLTMTVKIALEGSEETRWISTLLGTQSGAKTGLPASENKPVGEKTASQEPASPEEDS